MDHFELVSQYKPTGDQPQAIKNWSSGSGESIGEKRVDEEVL